jgi:hypothetical protein
MTLMSKSGRILVIDDKIDEAYPIMRILSKKGVKYSFFTGNVKEIPNERFYDIRLVFLDLFLQGDSKSQSFDLINSTFKGIFDKTNSPIIIILWTANQEDFLDFCKFYGEKIHFPEIIDIVPVNKNDYFERDADGIYVPKRNEDVVYSELIEKILQTIPNNHWFHVHTFWDNLINDASVRSINNFLTIFPYNREIDKEMWSLIFSLAFAYSGENLDIRDKNDVIKNAMMSYNMVFLDELENLIINSDYKYEIKNASEIKIVNVDTAAKIHKKIHFVQNEHFIIPGTIILQHDENLKFLLIKDLLKKDFGSITNFADIWKTTKSIICEISPICDCFTNKWKKHRILYGLMYQTKFEDKFKGDNGYLYSTIPFEFEGHSYNILLDFRLLDAMPLDYFEDDVPILRLRQSILSEIQIKCGAHVNRLGIISITPTDFKKWLKRFDT